MKILKDLNSISGSFKYVLTSACLLASFSATAAPLDLLLLKPDITANFVSTDYDAGTDIFTATGFTQTINDGTSTTSINGSFSLTANISAGGILNSGSFTADDGTNLLISGDFFDFGFSITGGTTLEFLFNSTGGSQEPDYIAKSSGIGGIILGLSGYNGDNFNSSFSTSFNAVADIAPVPIPAALWLFGTGLLALVGIGRRKV